MVSADTGRPRLLDLYCGAGGASMGYHRAGFDVVGVDINPQPRYPFEFHQGDALAFLTTHGHEFAAVHASPPCQSETDLRHRTGTDYQDWLTPTLAALLDLGRPWVVENVESTDKLPGALVLCGSTFGLTAGHRVLRRHRRFGANVWLWPAGGCRCSGRPVGGVYGTGGTGQMTRGYKFRPAEARQAMGIPWMTYAELAQAIPPAFTEFVGEQLLGYVGAEMEGSVTSGA